MDDDVSADVWRIPRVDGLLVHRHLHQRSNANCTLFVRGVTVSISSSLCATRNTHSRNDWHNLQRSILVLVSAFNIWLMAARSLPGAFDQDITPTSETETASGDGKPLREAYGRAFNRVSDVSTALLSKRTPNLIVITYSHPTSSQVRNLNAIPDCSDQ